MKFLLLLLLGSIHLSAQSQWVDPHDMDTTTKQKIKNVSKDVKSHSCINETPNLDIGSELYFRRIIRLLLDNANFDEANTAEFHKGHINIQFNEQDYNFLVEFAKNERPNKKDFNEVQSILEGAVQKTSYDRYTEYIISFQNQIYFMLFNNTTAILACSLFFLYICYKLVRAQFTWREILIYFTFLMYVMDFVVTYLYLYEVEEIENMMVMKTHGTVPPECDPKKMGYLTYIKFVYGTKFSESDCKSYFRASYQNLNYLVTPLKVFNHQLGVLIVQPLTHVGAGLGNFATSLNNSLPFPYSIILFPIMVIVALILATIILIFVTDSQLKINFFHLIHFELGGPRPSSIQQPARNAVQHVVTHRSLIENVPQNVSIKGTNAVGRSEDNGTSNSAELAKTRTRTRRSWKVVDKFESSRDKTRKNLESSKVQNLSKGSTSSDSFSSFADVDESLRNSKLRNKPNQKKEGMSEILLSGCNSNVADIKAKSEQVESIK